MVEVEDRSRWETALLVEVQKVFKKIPLEYLKRFRTSYPIEIDQSMEGPVGTQNQHPEHPCLQ